MTPIPEADAKRLGYEIMAASLFEVGLVKSGQGVRTWFCSDFDRRLPSLDHPTIQAAIRANEAQAT